MKIAIASDHAGYSLKEHLKQRLRSAGHDIEDYGAHDERPVDYPDVGRPAAQAVGYGHADRAILIDGAGMAMTIVANRVRFVRAALCTAPCYAAMAREHNDANVLCLGGRMIGTHLANQIVDAFLDTPFGGPRHQRRIDKIDG